MTLSAHILYLELGRIYFDPFTLQVSDEELAQSKGRRAHITIGKRLKSTILYILLMILQSVVMYQQL